MVMAGFPNWERFDEVADTYDHDFLTPRRPAKRLAEWIAPSSNARVLELGCGTGIFTAYLAAEMQRGGSVLATDIAEQMIAVARKKNIGGESVAIKLQEADGSSLPLEDNSFDLAVSALALFGFPDVPKALREWQRVVKPGGSLAFSSFSTKTVYPTQDPAVAPIFEKFGVSTRGAPENPVDTVEKCSALLRDLRLESVVVLEEDLGYYDTSFDGYWRSLCGSIFGLKLNAMPSDAVVGLRNELRAALAASFDGDGYYRNSRIILARGKNPNSESSA
jgi:ubiquinone/menaquinone biosynthesis C-methylase UbiE